MGPKLYLFGGFILNEASETLFWRECFVPLPTRLFRTLLSLVRSRGVPVKRTDLLDTVWESKFVEEGNLTQAIANLRKALNSFEPEVTFIKTVPRYGYQFLPAVREVLPKPTLDQIGPNLNGGVNREVARLLLKSEYCLRIRSPRHLNEAVAALSAALALEPDRADIHFNLARALCSLVRRGVSSPVELFTRARASIERVLPSQYRRSESLSLLGEITMHADLDLAGAQEFYERALEEGPTVDVMHSYSKLLLAQGKPEAAVSQLQTALNLNPSSLSIRTTMALAAFAADDIETAHQQLYDVVSLKPDFVPAVFGLGMGYGLVGDHAKAIEHLAACAKLIPGEPSILASLAYGHGAWGDPGVVADILDELRKLAAQRYVAQYDLALVYAGIGERRQAAMLLRSAIKHREYMCPWIAIDPRVRDYIPEIAESALGLFPNKKAFRAGAEAAGR